MTPVKPLEGVRVIEFATLIAGPHATSMLAGLGADVIKVEPVTGDPARAMVPPSAPDLVAPVFLANNVGKRSVALDLKTEAGARIARQLIDSADVVVDNYRRGVLTRLGLDPDRIMADNPRLIWITIAGYGPDGSAADRPAVDQIIQADAGMMATTGTTDVAGYKSGYPAVDHPTAHIVVQLALALLLHRATTGTGMRHVVSLFDVALSLQTTPLTDYLVSGTVPQRLGNAGPLSAPADTFRAADGEIMIVAYQDLHWTVLCTSLGIEHLQADPRFDTRLARIRNRLQLNEEIEAATSTMTCDEVEVLLAEAGIMVSKIRSYPEVVESDQVTRNQRLVPVVDSEGIAYQTVRHPVDVFQDADQPRTVPDLGQDSEAVLTELGLLQGEIDELAGRGVVRQPDRAQASPSARG